MNGQRAIMDLIASLATGTAMSFIDARPTGRSFGYVQRNAYDRLAFDERMSSIAVWNRPLTVRERALLKRGCAPRDVAPAALMFYLP
jgi:hypothetical protein